MLQRLVVNKVDVYEDKTEEPIRTTTYSYNLKYFDYEQFLNDLTIVDDDRTQTYYSFAADVKKRSRWIDITDQYSEVIGNRLVTQSGYYYDMIPYNTKVKIYDDQTGQLLEAHENEFELDTMRIIQTKTTRGDGYREVDYSYDEWAM